MVEALVTYGFTLHSRIHYHATWFWRWSWDGLWTLFWALTISWSRLLARVQSGPKCESHLTHKTESPWPLRFKHSHWWKRQSWSKFASHYAWGTNEVSECTMDVKYTRDSYITSNGSRFMVTWIIFINRLVEVGPTQNWETMALWTLTTMDLFWYIMHEDPHG